MDNHLMVYIHYKYTFKILILKCLVITHLHGLLLLLSSMKFSKNIFVSTKMLTGEEDIYYHICRIASTGMFWYSLKTKQCKFD